jgi:hypothetical protein
MMIPPPSSSNTSSTNTSNANNNAASTTMPTMNTDYTKTVNVKKVPFDGTKTSFYLWTTQILGFAETYNCAQTLLGTITVPPASAVLSDEDPDEHKLLEGRIANSIAMVLLRISLTDDISVDHIYTSRTPELPQGSARKVCLNLHKISYPVSTEKMHERKNEFTMCTLTREDTNPDIWFAQLNKIRQKLTDNYSLTTYEYADVLQHIVYNTKPFMYQIILEIYKDRLAHEIKRHAADNSFVFTVTLDSVQEEFSQKFSSSKKASTPGKSQPVLLLFTPSPKTSFTERFQSMW